MEKIPWNDASKTPFFQLLLQQDRRGDEHPGWPDIFNHKTLPKGKTSFIQQNTSAEIKK
ncbi:hypothetical protein [Paludifilum halophilum]|uniref:hypothetical protein n=1 Tax=Paludifilum halophilum TaxID=1642702 RepID=UPI00146F2E3E|nr:hypothetical protein [Paludifilum halophilum]